MLLIAAPNVEIGREDSTLQRISLIDFCQHWNTRLWGVYWRIKCHRYSVSRCKLDTIQTESSSTSLIRCSDVCEKGCIDQQRDVYSFLLAPKHLSLQCIRSRLNWEWILTCQPLRNLRTSERISREWWRLAKFLFREFTNHRPDCPFAWIQFRFIVTSQCGVFTECWREWWLVSFSFVLPLFINS